MRIYQTGSVEVQALQGLDLIVDSGEMVAVVGASGSGKSTLLSILAGIDVPTAGRARVDRWDLLAMSRADHVHYRRHTVGFLRQQTASNLVGQEGRVTTPVVSDAPRGKVELNHQSWSAVTRGAAIPVDARVVVTEVDGVILVVRPKEESA